MSLAQIAPALFRLPDGKIGIQVTVRALGLCDDVNDLVRGALQFLIRSCRKDKPHCLQPLGHIRVLEHGPVKIPFTQAGRYLEIHQAVAWLRILDPVIDGIPLVGDDHLLDQ